MNYAKRIELSSSKAICVDLDGTLLKSNFLWEAVSWLVKNKPLLTIKIPLWFFRGSGYLRIKIAESIDMKIEALLWNKDVLKFVENQKKSGHQIVLVTGVSKIFGDKVASHFKFFDRVFLAEERLSFFESEKLKKLNEEFGEKGFCYIGDSKKDIPILKQSFHGYVVGDVSVFKKLKELNAQVSFVDSEEGLLAGNTLNVVPFCPSASLGFYSCSVCSSDKYNILYNIKGFNIVQCGNCDFVFVNPRIKDTDLHKIYSENYFTNESGGYGYHQYELTSQLRLKTFEKWFKEIEPFLTKEKGTVLDIGCASGHFLELIKEKGWEVEGIELDKEMVKKLKEKNIKVFSFPFEEFVCNKKYKLITMFDVVEHIPDLKKTFKKLHDLLDDDGVIAIITPNFNSTQRKLFGRNWFQYKPHEHIQYFSPETLAKAVRPYGLIVAHSSSSGQYADMEFLFDRLDRYKFKGLKNILKAAYAFFGLKNSCWYVDTGSLFAILKKNS